MLAYHVRHAIAAFRPPRFMTEPRERLLSDCSCVHPSQAQALKDHWLGNHSSDLPTAFEEAPATCCSHPVTVLTTTAIGVWGVHALGPSNTGCCPQ